MGHNSNYSNSHANVRFFGNSPLPPRPNLLAVGAFPLFQSAPGEETISGRFSTP